jgi:hypothetical protein
MPASGGNLRAIASVSSFSCDASAASAPVTELRLPICRRLSFSSR